MFKLNRLSDTKRPLKVAGGIILAAWLMLIFSGWGFLFMFVAKPSRSELVCHYFMGTRTFTRTHPFYGDDGCATWAKPSL